MARRKIRATEVPGGDAPGITLEKVVARIQQMFDPNSEVTHNELLEDRVSNKRQYDVVIRGHFGGRPVLGVIECKDHSRRKGPDAVEAFAKKSENLGANLRIMVSKKGFTEQALRLAKHENIGCLSLLPAEPAQVGFSIGYYWYGVLSRWEDVRLTVQFPTETPPIANFDINSVKIDKKQVIKWFLREIFTKHGNETEEGEHAFQFTFDTPRQIEIADTYYLVNSITCIARRTYKKKRIWVNWSGDAFYDWHTGQLSIPAQSQLTGSSVNTDLATWPDFAGEIPILGSDHSDQRSLTIILYGEHHWDPNHDGEVPDLDKL